MLPPRDAGGEPITTLAFDSEGRQLGLLSGGTLARFDLSA
jgi:hypothetical protein